MPSSTKIPKSIILLIISAIIIKCAEDISIVDTTGADLRDLCSPESQFTLWPPCFALMWVFKRLLMPYIFPQAMRQHCSGPFWDICRPIEDREFTNDQIGNFRTYRETIFWGKFSGRRLEILFPPLHKCRYCKVKVKGSLATLVQHHLVVQIFDQKPNLTADLVRD